MPKLTLQSLGRKMMEKRGMTGIRAIAKGIGVSPATFSRVERGHLPDIETFGKICRWLDLDPGEVLGVVPTIVSKPRVAAHFKIETALSPDTAKALAQMILAAQRALAESQKTGGK